MTRPPLDVRLEAARREGWSLKLHAADCSQIVGDQVRWLERGLTTHALKRIRAAVARTARYGYANGARLSDGEVAIIRAAFEIGPAEGAGPGGGRNTGLGRGSVSAPSFP